MCMYVYVYVCMCVYMCVYGGWRLRMTVYECLNVPVVEKAGIFWAEV